MNIMNVNNYLENLTSLEFLEKYEYDVFLYEEYCRLGGSLNTDQNLINLFSTMPEITVRSFLEKLYDPTVPNSIKATLLILAIEPCPRAIQELNTYITDLVCMIDKIEFDKLAPELHDLAFFTIITCWKRRHALLKDSVHQSVGTLASCTNNEYRKLPKAILWATERWMNEKPERLRALFDRLPIDSFLDFGDMLVLLIDRDDLLDEFLLSIKETTLALEKLRDFEYTDRLTEKAKQILSSIWKNIPIQLVRVGKENLKKLIEHQSVQLNLPGLFYRPDNFFWPEGFQSGCGLIELIGLLYEINETSYIPGYLIDDIFWQRDNKVPKAGSGLLDLLSMSLLEIQDKVLIEAGLREKDEIDRSDIDLNSSLLRLGIHAVSDCINLNPKDIDIWCGPIIPYLAYDILKNIKMMDEMNDLLNSETE